MVSAGMINPAVLKRFTTFWLAQEQIDSLKNTMTEIKQYTGQNYLIEKPILRVFMTKKKKLMAEKSDDESLKPFLSKDFVKLNSVKNPFECGVVNQSARLNVSGFFTDMMNFLENQNYLIKEKFDYQLLKPNDSTYKDISFKK